MTQEKRFLLALGLVVAILGLWSLLTPPAPPSSNLPITKETKLVQEPQPPEPVQKVEIGEFELGLGKISAGIQQFRVDGTDLLNESTVPFLGIELPSQGGPVSWKETFTTDALTHEAVLPNGVVISRKLSLAPDRSKFLLHSEIEIYNQGKQPQPVDLRLTVYRPLKVNRPEDKRHLAGFAQLDAKQVPINLRRGEKKSWDKLPTAVSSQAKSHALIVQPMDSRGMFHVEHSPSGDPVGLFQLTREIAPGARETLKLRIYAGPLETTALHEAGVEHAVSFGIFSGITLLLLKFLHWSYGWLHSYGWAICLLSFSVWLPFAPLTWYSMRMSSRTMEKMAAIKPQEARLRKEFQNNPAKMQQELLALYRKHNINPASGCLGCLPLMVTMPVYIALFQVLTRAPELRNAAFLWIRDLSAPDALIRFPLAIPLLGPSLNVLPLLATTATYFQQSLMQRPQGELTDEQKAQQQIFKLFPLMLLVFFYNMPAGFMIYWTVNSTLMVSQQLLVSRLTKKA